MTGLDPIVAHDSLKIEQVAKANADGCMSGGGESGAEDGNGGWQEGGQEGGPGVDQTVTAFCAQTI